MTDVFLDTVGMIAVWDDTDQWHPGAKAAYERLLAQGRRLVTTHLVLCECGNASPSIIASAALSCHNTLTRPRDGCLPCSFMGKWPDAQQDQQDWQRAVHRGQQ